MSNGFSETMGMKGVYYTRHLSPKEGMREKCLQVLLRIEKLKKFIDMFLIGSIVKKYINHLQSKYESMTFVKDEDTINNVITTLARNAILDSALAGSNFSVTGPFMGLISSVGYTGVPVIGDTMTSHATWVEAGSASNFPLYTVPRKTCVWASAGSGAKALSAALSFVCVTTGGTVKGAFLVFGTGAVFTIADTNGILLSAGLFTGGDKTIAVADTLQVSYTLTTS